MKRKLLILSILTVCAVFTFLFQEWNRRSAQNSATVQVTMQGMTMLPEGTRFYLHTDEKLEQLPVVVFKRQPATEDQTQTFDVSIYRHGEKTPDGTETLPCEEGGTNMPFAERRNGSDFHFLIPHAKVEGDSFQFILNGKDLGVSYLHGARREPDDSATQKPDAKPSPADDQTANNPIAEQPAAGDDQP